MRLTRKSRRSTPFEPLEARRLLSVSASAHVDVLSTTGSGSATIYNYQVSLTNSGTTPVGSFWFGWVPGENFLPSKPAATGSPAGWTSTITGSDSSTDGSAIEWVAGSTAAAIAVGSSSTAFTFSSTDSPTQLNEESPTHPSTRATTAEVYSGVPFSDAGSQFLVTVDTAIPTPTPTGTTIALLTSSTTATAGQSLTLTATVASSGGDVSTATGTVTFLDNGTSIGTGSVGSNGIATLTTTALPTGTDTLTASYGGDANFSTSTSSPVTENISAASPAGPVESASASLHLLAITGTPASPVYHYDITLTDTGTTTIGTFWYAWTPHENFLPTAPIAESSPAGWGNAAGAAATPDVTGPEATPDGTGLRWVARSTAAELSTGQSLTGFDFTSTDMPTALAGLSPTHTSAPVGTSFVYAGAPFSDSGFSFAVISPAAPAKAHLQPVFSGKLPTSVLTRGVFNPTVPITITNFDDNTSTGPVTVALYAAPDGSLDGTQIPLTSTTIRKLSVKADRKAAIGLHLRNAPTSLTAGTYTLIAAVSDSDSTVLQSASTGVLAVTDPVVHLSATVATNPAAVIPGQIVTVAVTITNTGNVNSIGVLRLTASLDSTTAASIGVPIPATKATIKPFGKPTVLRLRFRILKTAVAGDYSVAVSITQGSATARATSITALTVA